MARAATSITIQRGDVLPLANEGGSSFFILYFDDTMHTSLVVDDDAWGEGEAFAKLLLDTIAQRRARAAKETA